jgi:(E)-4-hydroxy-3-methylbut-2-enyl-diphosphate synthase
MSLWGNPESQILNPKNADAVDPYVYTKRPVAKLALSPDLIIGPELPPRVVTRVVSVAALAEAAQKFAATRLADTPVEGLLVPIATAADLAAAANLLPRGAVLFAELPATATPADFSAHSSFDIGHSSFPAQPGLVLVRTFDASPAAAEALAGFAKLTRARGHTLTLATTAEALSPDSPLAATLRQLGDASLLITLDASVPDPAARHEIGRYRALAESLRTLNSHAPLWIRSTQSVHSSLDIGHWSFRGGVSTPPDFLSRLLDASVLAGTLLCDGLGDLVSIETEPDPVRALKLTYNVLQGAGTRSSKTEFVACPSCGRTLFDLQTTTQRIRARTGHLKGVKIAIMGCIVNGPGEMADADFGYVGGAPAKINLYVGKQCVQYNLPQAEADEHLVALIKAHGKWVEPPAAV